MQGTPAIHITSLRVESANTGQLRPGLHQCTTKIHVTSNFDIYLTKWLEGVNKVHVLEMKHRRAFRYLLDNSLEYQVLVKGTFKDIKVKIQTSQQP